MVLVLAATLPVFRIYYWSAYGMAPVPIYFSLALIAVVVGGVSANIRRPDSKTGHILIIYGLFVLAGWFGYLDSGFLTVFWYSVFPAIGWALLAHALLTYPDGHVHTAAERWFLAAIYATPLFGLAQTTVANPIWLIQCAPARCPTDPLSVHASIEMFRGIGHVAAWTAVACGLWFLALVVFRRRRMLPAQRRTAAPVLWATAYPLAYFLYDYALRLFVPFTTESVWWRTLNWGTRFLDLWVPGALVVGLFTTKLARADVATVLVRLRTASADELRPALARLLRDPSLEVALPTEDGDGYVDPAGRVIQLPEAGDARVVTDIGEGILVLHHPSAQAEDPQLFEAAIAAARMTLDNARLTAQVRAQLIEVSASRQRLINAADDGRRRLERDLHDGAQQGLLGVGMTLEAARHALPAGSNVAQLMDEAATQLRDSLAELRTLARGLHPALLAERGLEVALRELIRHVPAEVTLTVDLKIRPDLTTETTVFFVVAEAMQNITRYANGAVTTVDVGDDGRLVRVTIGDNGPGGASPRPGSGLRGLTDRVAAAGGQMTVTSPPGNGTTITASLPLRLKSHTIHQPDRAGES